MASGLNTAAQPSVAAHLAACLAVARPIEPLTVALADAQACLLVGNLAAPGPLPAYGTALLDGYAVRMQDASGATPQAPVVLPVVADLRAGAQELNASVQPGFAIRVSGGAPLPPGTETVVPLTWTDGGLTRVAILQAPPAGAWSRRMGEDLAEGSPLLEHGTLLGPAQLALLATAGISEVRVRPRPRVVVISTGRGLVDIGQAPGPGQVVDANSHALAAAAREAGAQPYRVGPLPEHPRMMLDTLEDHLIRADIVIGTGAADIISGDLATIGSVTTSRVTVAPGGSFSVGTIGPDNVPYFGLPGHPLSALIAFELFVRPALRQMVGAATVQRPRLHGTLAQPVRSSPGLEQYLRCRVDRDRRGILLTPLGGPKLHPLQAFGTADALAVIPADVAEVETGADLEAIILERRHI